MGVLTDVEREASRTDLNEEELKALQSIVGHLEGVLAKTTASSANLEKIRAGVARLRTRAEILEMSGLRAGPAVPTTSAEPAPPAPQDAPAAPPENKN